MHRPSGSKTGRPQSSSPESGGVAGQQTDWDGPACPPRSDAYDAARTIWSSRCNAACIPPSVLTRSGGPALLYAIEAFSRRLHITLQAVAWCHKQEGTVNSSTSYTITLPLHHDETVGSQPCRFYEETRGTLVEWPQYSGTSNGYSFQKGPLYKVLLC